MRYEFKHCEVCGKRTVHFGSPFPTQCFRHKTEDEIERQIRVHEFEDKTRDILRTAVDWTFLWMEKKEREAEHAGV